MSHPVAGFGAIHDAVGAPSHIEDGTMKTRRMAYWWFRFVVSGRFIEKFLDLRRVRRSERVAAKTIDKERTCSADRDHKPLLRRWISPAS
jgi:hypothetical protein